MGNESMWAKEVSENDKPKSDVIDLLEKSWYKLSNNAKVSEGLGWVIDITDNKWNIIKTYKSNQIDEKKSDPWFKFDDTELKTLIESWIIEKVIEKPQGLDNKSRLQSIRLQERQELVDDFLDILKDSWYKLSDGGKISEGFDRLKIELTNSKWEIIETYDSKRINDNKGEQWFNFDDKELENLVNNWVIEKI